MAQATMNIRMDADLKKQFEAFCSEIGMTMTTAVCVFAKMAVKERRIPFEIKADPDPFYLEENMRVLRERAAAIRSGKAKLKEHGLIQGKR